MDANNTMILTAVIVTVGRWAQGKHLDVRVVTAAVFLAIMLGALDSTSPLLARRFSQLILVSALMIYAIPIAKKTGMSHGK